MVDNLTALKSTQSWAIPVPDRDDIPASFIAEYDLHFKSDEAPYVLYNPVQDRVLNVSDEKLICLGTDRLVVLAQNRAPFSCRFDDAIYLQHDELLLAFSISIFTASDEISIDYNAACSDLFEPILGKFRVRGEATKDGHFEWKKLAELAKTDLKFTNYARQILRDSGNLIDLLYQSEVVADQKTVVDTSLLVLTDTELCWVNNARKEWIEEPAYGGVFHFAPRTQVTGCQILPATEDGLVQLLVTLKGNYSWRIPYSNSLKDQLAELVAKITS